MGSRDLTAEQCRITGEQLAPILRYLHRLHNRVQQQAFPKEDRMRQLVEAAHKRREESDFLAETNHDGGRFDFHALWHTCGAWLAMSGVHPKVVQTVMRHSTITLTMDTYGNLFPGQEAEAVGKPGLLLGCVDAVLAEQEGTTTGTTEDAIPCDTEAQLATQCESEASDVGIPNSFSEKGLCEVVRHDAKQNETRAARTRTGNQRIMSRAGDSTNAAKSGVSENEAQGQAQSDPDLAAIVAAWPTLPPAIRAAMLALVKAAR